MDETDGPGDLVDGRRRVRHARPHDFFRREGLEIPSIDPDRDDRVPDDTSRLRQEGNKTSPGARKVENRERQDRCGERERR
jgi:hypothetical protein